MKEYGESVFIDPRLLDLNTSWSWVVSFTPLPLNPRGKRPRYPSNKTLGGRGGEVVKALCYKPDGSGFETPWGTRIFFSLPNPSGRTMSRGFTQPLTEMNISTQIPKWLRFSFWKGESYVNCLRFCITPCKLLLLRFNSRKCYTPQGTKSIEHLELRWKDRPMW
jgi:hypothetical protein